MIDWCLLLYCILFDKLMLEGLYSCKEMILWDDVVEFDRERLVIYIDFFGCLV